MRTLCSLLLLLCASMSCSTAERSDAADVALHDSPVDALLARAVESGWGELPIGDRVAAFGLSLQDTPYLDGSLEGPGPEQCRITMDGFDCVTFMEICLNMARITRGTSDSAPGLAELRDAMTFTRYRGGVLTDYTSRLHYTSEWIADNVAKGVLQDVTLALGGSECALEVDFMSEHPDLYAALDSNPAFVDSMRAIERRISNVPRACIARDDVAEAEKQFRTGDLIAIVTSIDGLDYSHTGMIVRDAEDVPRFLHASSKNERVFLDGRLSEYLESGSKRNSGISVLRPLEPAR